MFSQLNPPLPLFIVSKNTSALAHGLIDYGPEHNLLWVCFLNDSGECWTVPNKDIRMEWNYSMSRTPAPLSKEKANETVTPLHPKKQNE